MRKDLQKLLCEQERRGSGRSYKEKRRSKEFNETAFDPEFSAGREGMKVRYVRGYGEDMKDFSENFNPLWGIIRKNTGRKWDDVYSELCQVFDMRNHVNAHILVHLWDFVETKAFIGEDGKVWVRGYRTVHVEDDSCEYYVHPVTNILSKNEGFESFKTAYRRNKAKYEKEREVLVVKISDTFEYRRKTVNDPWFGCRLKACPPPKVTYKARKFSATSKEYYRNEYDYVACWDTFYKKSVEKGAYCFSHYTVSHKELVKHGLIDK